MGHKTNSDTQTYNMTNSIPAKDQILGLLQDDILHWPGEGCNTAQDLCQYDLKANLALENKKSHASLGSTQG